MCIPLGLTVVIVGYRFFVRHGGKERRDGRTEALKGSKERGILKG